MCRFINLLLRYIIIYSGMLYLKLYPITLFEFLSTNWLLTYTLNFNKHYHFNSIFFYIGNVYHIFIVIFTIILFFNIIFAPIIRKFYL
uniref:Uncharacterized protein n=1 Tax=Euplotes vanleeuwenhoeki TaxID=2794224 RepID=A0A7T1FUY5_9SPIT|nr:hypothetical protein KQ443_mgp29 [Euplotes vanleeuwenhoeki]QPM99249.1 hypothetical protein MitoLV_21 [Euplotes vanleeuwenhoeki]